MQTRIRNIYYMLAYAYSSLVDKGLKKLSTEKFENVSDLCSAILVAGVSKLIKQGMGKSYIEQTETLSCLKGKINITDSIKTRSVMKNQIVCCYDEYSVDFDLNQILKTTMMLLLTMDIPKARKKDIRRLLLYFSDVGTIDLKMVDWNKRYNRNNQHYQALISICYLLYKGVILNHSDGKVKAMDMFDEQRMCRLYEKFILGYYNREFKNVKGFKATASQVKWQLDTGDSKDMLPIMQTDIYLECKNKILILDAKYYSHATQIQFGANKLHSGNLYQIFTYVQNKAYEVKDEDVEVSGMLLYAATNEDVQPDNTYHICGNEISAKTLDLDCDFNEIKRKLNSIVYDYFDL